MNNQTTKQILIVAILVNFSLLMMPQNIYAQGSFTCSIAEEDLVPLIDTGDDRIQTDAWCHSTTDHVQLKYWNDFGFYNRWWDEGWGVNDPCNGNLPYARMMNTIWQVEYAGTTLGITLGNSSKSYYEWMTNNTPGINKIKRLRAKCESNVPGWGAPRAGTFFATRTVYFYLHGFYDEDRNAVQRAGTLAHERGHLTGKWHNGQNSVCCQGSGCRCDESWEWQGPYYHQANFLWDYVVEEGYSGQNSNGCWWPEGHTPSQNVDCYKLSDIHLDNIRIEADDILRDRFETSPPARMENPPRSWVLEI